MRRRWLHYISARRNSPELDELAGRMMAFYSTTPTYYEDIDYALAAWSEPSELIHEHIVSLCKGAENQSICEVGCGRAGILRTGRISPGSYHGCDFSQELLRENRQNFPTADFQAITESGAIPFADSSFDFVFTVFVLEHVVQPKRFLSELVRICKPGGRIAILCPDFFGRRSITSQRMGKSGSSGRQKLRRGQVAQAIETLILSRLVMPIYFFLRLRNAHREPVYLLNASPACFEQEFYADADAVYVTQRGEIDRTLADLNVEPCPPTVISEQVTNFVRRKKLIYAVYERRPRS